MKKTYWLLFGIVVIAAILRFYQLGAVPVGFQQDEAFLTYNGYSIMHTGRDMTGNFLPLHLESFLFSPAGYSYLSIPFMAIFGLTPFSARFASAFFGTLTIPLTYFFVVELFRKSNTKELYALISSFILAISPWHINLSRTATENIPVVFFITLGVYFFLYWFHNKKILFFGVAFLSFFLSLFIYQAPRSFLPLLIPMILLFYYRTLTTKERIYTTVVFSIVIILPVLFILHSKDLSTRITSLSIFQYPETQLLLNESLKEDGVLHISPNIARVFHNKPLSYLGTFEEGYFKNLTFDFLFTDQGLPTRYRIPEMGLLYIFELPCILYGIFMLLKNKSKPGGILVFWVLLSFVGGALTFDDVPNLQRGVIVYPALAIITAYGLVKLISLIQNIHLKRITIGIISFIILCNIAYYLHQYYISQIVYRPWYRQEGYEEMVKTVNNLSTNNHKIYITSGESAPTIFLLFFSQYNPSLFQQEINSAKSSTTKKSIEVVQEFSFDKYVFIHTPCPLNTKTYLELNKSKKVVAKGEKGALYVEDGQCSSLPTEGAQLIKQIKRGDGTLVFSIYRKL